MIVDGADNFPTRYLTNDACVLLGRPNVHGSIFRFDGQATVFDARHGPCYRCLYPEPPPPGAVPSCAEGGVLGVLPGLVALIQATETVKIVTGAGDPLYGRLLQFDALRMEFHEFRVEEGPACPVCGSAPSITELIDYDGLLRAARGGRSAGRVRRGQRARARRAPRARGEELLLARRARARRVARPRASRARGSCRSATLDGAARGARRVARAPGGRALPPRRAQREGVRAAAPRRGFRRVENLAGGIEAWSLTVDPGVPRY